MYAFDMQGREGCLIFRATHDCEGRNTYFNGKLINLSTIHQPINSISQFTFQIISHGVHGVHGEINGVNQEKNLSPDRPSALCTMPYALLKKCIVAQIQDQFERQCNLDIFLLNNDSLAISADYSINIFLVAVYPSN